jgi:putative sigma-54 modulation protein
VAFPPVDSTKTNETEQPTAARGCRLLPLVVKGKNMDLSESQRAYIEGKLGKLDRYLDNITKAEVELSREKTKTANDRLVVQVTLTVNGTILRAQEKSADFKSAVDTVADVVQRQIDHYKGKHWYSRERGPSKRQAAAAGTEPLSVEDIEEEEAPRIARVKRFAMKPMSTEEAVEQMELLGHGFFVFLNEATGQVSVLYRREDSSYGLIEPELG